jgi:hypothetical protein
MEVTSTISIKKIAVGTNNKVDGRKGSPAVYKKIVKRRKQLQTSITILYNGKR